MGQPFRASMCAALFSAALASCSEARELNAAGSAPIVDAGDDSEPMPHDGAIDATTPDPDASTPASYEAPCTTSAASVVCEYTLTELTTRGGTRNVYWTKPIGAPLTVSYPGKFRALAIQAGSYATCLGPFCEVPDELPSDHPPTLFLHGDADATVPVDTAIAYRDALEAQGIETDMIIDMGIGHAWLERAPEAITRWFSTH